ncbi:g10139 [Coccomyxa elongata]
MVKVLIVGATGFLGNMIAKEAVKLGHQVTALVSEASQSNKKDIVDGLKAVGVMIKTGSLDSAHKDLVDVLKTVEVVVSVVNGPGVATQTKLVAAAKEAGTIKQFMPSEFGVFGAVGEASVPLMFGPKAQVRAALEAAGIPHTYVVSYGFASYWANGLGELGQKNRVPPSPSTSNKVPFYGTGRTKLVMNVEEDIAAFTARAIGDVRTINKQLHVRPPLNALSQHDMAYIWEDKIFRQLCIGSRLDRAFVSNADLEQRIASAQDPIKKTLLQLQKVFTVDGVTTPLGANDVEASRLYPDYFYTPIAKYMNNLIDTFRVQLAAEE